MSAHLGEDYTPLKPSSEVSFPEEWFRSVKNKVVSTTGNRISTAAIAIIIIELSNLIEEERNNESK